MVRSSRYFPRFPSWSVPSSQVSGGFPGRMRRLKSLDQLEISNTNLSGHMPPLLHPLHRKNLFILIPLRSVCTRFCLIRRLVMGSLLSLFSLCILKITIFTSSVIVFANTSILSSAKASQLFVLGNSSDETVCVIMYKPVWLVRLCVHATTNVHMAPSIRPLAGCAACEPGYSNLILVIRWRFESECCELPSNRRRTIHEDTISAHVHLNALKVES